MAASLCYFRKHRMKANLKRGFNRLFVVLSGSGVDSRLIREGKSSVSSDLLPKWQLSGLSHEEPPDKTRADRDHHYNNEVRLVDLE
jgi:hypothetical protein